ncbi:MAG: trypsin-like peptidase domain-containing protein [Bacillota bacterium]
MAFRASYPAFARHGRTSLWSYLAMALIGALLGGALVLAVAPSVLPTPAPVLLRGTLPNLEPPAAGTDPSSAYPAVTVARTVGPAVVGIIKQVTIQDWFGQRRTQESSGSGVIFDSQGYIATNHHVIAGASQGQVVVILSDGREVPGTVVGSDAATDLAVVKIAPPVPAIAVFGDSDTLKVGEPAFAIGNPMGMAFARTVTAGIISGLDRRVVVGERTFNLIQTDAAINPGNSGGPLVNAHGLVVGINTARLEQVEGMGFAIPINLTRPILQTLIEKGYVARAWLGVRTADRAVAARYGIQFDQGVYVVEAIVGGPAAKAGVRAGDILLSLGGRAVNSGQDLRQAIEVHKIGDSVTLSVVRNRQQLTLTAVLSEMPVQ